jgi:hypothetical protein
MYASFNRAEEGAPAWLNPGYHLLYHDDGVNHCPGCGKQHWLVGRLMAECAFCETALPLERAYRYRFGASADVQ